MDEEQLRSLTRRNKNLKKFARKISRKAGFTFRTPGPSELVIFDDTRQYHWRISGELPFTYEGEKAELRFRTDELSYINGMCLQLGWSRWGSERHRIDSERTLFLPDYAIQYEVGYFNIYKDFKRKTKGDKWRGCLDRDGLYDSRLKHHLEEVVQDAEEEAKKEFPNLFQILIKPRVGFFLVYRDQIDLSEEYELLRRQPWYERTMKQVRRMMIL